MYAVIIDKRHYAAIIDKRHYAAPDCTPTASCSPNEAAISAIPTLLPTLQIHNFLTLSS